MEQIIALAKRKGFIFQGSEIYGGLSGTWDYGPLGVALKNNIKQVWWKRFVLDREDMYGVDAAILMNQNVWKASGHVAGFSDPLVEDLKTQKRYRADHLLEEIGVNVQGMKIEQMDAMIKEKGIKSPDGNPLGDVRQFNMMFQTFIGPATTNFVEEEHADYDSDGNAIGIIEEQHVLSYDPDSISYLRPETAQGMFVNFKNVLDSMHPKIPFGMAQIGKAFRNEIAPQNFVFRTREFEQMEIEYFVHPNNWQDTFEHFRTEAWAFMKDIGLDAAKTHELEVADEDRAHYSKRTIDFEYEYPFGKKELYGLAYRTDFDLKSHTEASGQDLTYFDEETKERYLPHCIEPSFGLDRTVLAVLATAYTEDEVGGEKRTYLKLSPHVAPVVVAVSPLLKNKPQLVEYARKIYTDLRKSVGRVVFDDNGNIGKRYRRQDEIGTPYCLVVDFDTLEGGTDGSLKDTVTIRFRDSGRQIRVPVAEVQKTIAENIEGLVVA